MDTGLLGIDWNFAGCGCGVPQGKDVEVGMRGLLVKDFRFALQNKKMMVMLVVIEAVFLVMQGAGSASFVMGYMMMGCGMLVLATITTDEYNKSMAFLMTLPVRRADYALEKYVFSFLCNLVGFFLAVVPYCVLRPDRVADTLYLAVVIMAVMLMLQMVMLPAQLKYGGERGRMVLLGVFAGGVLMFTWGRKVWERALAGSEGLQEFAARMAEGIKGLDAAVAGIGAVLLCIVCFVISLSVSRRIMEKKEF